MHELQRNTEVPLSVFISYAHEDEPWRQRLETHLSLLRRQGLISDWHDRQILAGEEWTRDIDQHLETASMILLLISPDFLASDYCYEIEMQRALERHKRGEARVIPIMLRPVDWHDAPFGHILCLPRDGKSVTEWDNQDAAFREIAQELRQILGQQPLSAHLASGFSLIDRQNRLRLLKRVRTIWIEGVLEHSLHQASLIALGLQEQPDALLNPWHLVAQETNRPPHPLPAGTSIVQIYDEADGELLLLGEPGAGKTTLLLELARTLLSRAESDEQERLPVVFNLSSWAEKRLPLSEWLVEELRIRYQVPRTLGNAWLAADHILLLLDGLDEVAEDARADCVQAINRYYQDRIEKVTLPLVVCCRSKEYMALSTRVNLHQAVSILPLTGDQIELYLQKARGQLEALSHALHTDPELYELARRPLMLSIFTLAYQGAAPEDLPTKATREAQQRQVFAIYVERMLTRRGISKRFSREQTLEWLRFLAAGMKQHHQTVFYIERLQPNWLSENASLLYGGISAGFIYGLLVGPGVGLSLGLLYGLFAGLAAGLVFGLLGKLDIKIHSAKTNTPPWVAMTRNLVRLLDNRVVFGTLAGLAGCLIVMLVNGSRYGLPTAIRSGLPNGLIGGVAFGLLGKLHTEIQPTETVTWSWIVMKKHLIKFLGIALGVGLVVGLTGALLGILVDRWIMELVFGLVTALIAVLLLGLLYGLIGSVSNEMLDERNLVTPNQGIWQSARNSILIGAIVLPTAGLLDGFLLGSFNGLLYGQAFGLAFGLHHGLRIGLFFGLAASLRYGGAACIQHIVLRLLLWHTGHAPLNYSRFLDEAAERLLLRKVGGGYIFIHRLLLDYFALLEKKES